VLQNSVAPHVAAEQRERYVPVISPMSVIVSQSVVVPKSEPMSLRRC
jgi:hypothetical protein